MFDKLFVRVKTWLGSDLDENAGSGRATPARPSKPDSKKPDTRDDLPPVPTQARDDKDSSGSIRLSDSGIIILDNEPEPPPRTKPGAPVLPQGVPEQAAWALPTLPKPGSPEAKASASAKAPSDSGFDWDEVLARARAKAVAKVKPSDPK